MEKVYLVIVEAMTDGIPSGSTKVFANRKDAEENFLEEVRAARIDAGDDWLEEVTYTSFETYDDGYYAINHITVNLEEKKVN